MHVRQANIQMLLVLLVLTMLKTTLFNHPWMAHRRDSELDISHILKDNLAGVINNMEHGETSQNGGRRPSMPGDLNLNT